MSDTIDSTFGKLSLNPEDPPRSRLSQSSSRLSQTSSQRSQKERQKTTLDGFFDENDPQTPRAAKQPAEAPVDAPQGILYSAREETRHVDAMEKEIFNLKLKISLLEKNSKLNADSKELYQQLTASHSARKALEAENASLRAQMGASEDMQFKLAEQEEALMTFLDAQDEYGRILDDMLRMFDEPELAEWAPRQTADLDQIDGKLAATKEVMLNLLSGVAGAHEKYAEMENALAEFIEEKEARDQAVDELCTVFECGEQQLVNSALELVAENTALEAQLQGAHAREAEFERVVEGLREQIPVEADELVTLRAENGKLMDAVSRASARSYDITRQFFRRLTAYMGAEWGEENDRRLRGIIEESRRNSKSKLPLLVELMMQCVDELAMMARGSELLPQENADLEEKVRYLEDLLTQELTMNGADKVLLARYEELEKRFKLETEKRKNEYIGYQRSLTNLSLQ